MDRGNLRAGLGKQVHPVAGWWRHEGRRAEKLVLPVPGSGLRLLDTATRMVAGESGDTGISSGTGNGLGLWWSVGS